jgi:tRNA 2-thiouridine synthesizing protein A
MSRLSKSEKEFVSDFGGLEPSAETDTPTDGSAVAADPVVPADPSGPEVIDARGISSPLPVLRAHRALRAMKPGQELRVITNAPETLAEFQALSKYVVGYELLSQDEADGEIVHLLRKKR